MLLFNSWVACKLAAMKVEFVDVKICLLEKTTGNQVTKEA